MSERWIQESKIIDKKLQSCIRNRIKEVSKEIDDEIIQRENIEKQLKARFGEGFNYEYESYGTLEDRYIIFYINEKRYKFGGSIDIDSWHESNNEFVSECYSKKLNDSQESKVASITSDKIGELAELDQLNRLLEDISQIPDELLENYESEY